MPFPKGAQQGRDTSKQQQVDLSVCGMCTSGFADDEERIEARCSACGTRAFHPACVAGHMDKQIRSMVKDRRQQERGRLWARNHPEQVFCRNGHIKHIPACPQAGCSGSMEAAELVKPRKAAQEQEEEPPNAPAPPAQPKGPKPKAKQPKVAAPAGQAAAGGQGVPRKATAASVKASAAPHAQLGGSASLSRASSSLSRSCGAGGSQTFAQQQLAQARAAAAAARAQLAAARGGHGSGSLGAAAAVRAGSAAGSRASVGQQLGRSGSATSAASSSIWTGAPSAALEAADDDVQDELEDEEPPPPPPPPRAPTPDLSQEAWPELGGGAQPTAARRGSSGAAASWAQLADSDLRGAEGGVDCVAPAGLSREQQMAYLRMLTEMEAQQAQQLQQAQQAQQQQQQQQQQSGWEHALHQPSRAAQRVRLPTPAEAMAAATAEAADWPAVAQQAQHAQQAQQALIDAEEWEDGGRAVDAASLAAQLRQQQDAFQRQLAAGQSGWEQPAGAAPVPVPQLAHLQWEQEVARAATDQQAHSMVVQWDQPEEAAAQPAPLLPPAPALPSAAPAWEAGAGAGMEAQPSNWTLPPHMLAMLLSLPGRRWRT